MLESCDSVSEIFASASDIELYSYLGNISNNVFRDSFIRPGYKFGDFKNTRGWVQCELQNNPVRRYYLNLRSLCTTRIRPVPLDVPLQIYSPSDRLYDSESDPEDQLLTVSDNEQKHDDCFVGSAASVVSGIASERNIDVFRKLYYGIDVRGIISDKDSEDSEESWNFMETNSHKENKIQSNYVPVKKSQGDAKPRAVLQETMEEQAEPRYLLSNFSDVQLRVSSTPLRLGSLKNKKNRNIKLSNNNKNGMKPHFAPRLQNFRKSKLMITEKQKIASAQKVVKKKQKPQFTVCEMYGTRTFNYNSDPEYSAIRKITNLSDSSVGTACWVDQEAKAIKSNSLWDNQLSLEIQGPNLSSSSSCSTSSSSCSTSSSSSSSGSSDSSDSSSDDSNSSSDDSKSSNDKINSSGMKNNSSSDKTNTSSNEK